MNEDMLFGPPLDDQIACVEREIALRQRAYPRWIADRRMSQAKAQHELDTMCEVLATLRRMKADAAQPD
jgi:hypothetical protein